MSAVKENISLLCADIPKFLTNQTVFYSWEGNPVNISCGVMSNPPATMLWRRERFTISEGTPNMQIHGSEGKSVLEVCVNPEDDVFKELKEKLKKCTVSLT